MRGLLILAFVFLSLSSHAQWSLELETGLGFQSYNEVRIPNETGTEFDFNREFKIIGPVIPFRFKPGYSFGRHHIFALYAPLNIDYEGAPSMDIVVDGFEFKGDSLLRGSYTFNSYRLTYRYDLISSEKFTLGLGITAKLRDASIRLTRFGTSYKKSNTGLVPLAHLMMAYHFEGLSLKLEGDGLAADSGRAFDVFFGIEKELQSQLSFRAGYRILEGGTDVDEIFNFTLIHFAALGLSWTF